MGVAERIRERREALEKTVADLEERLELAELLAGGFAPYAGGDVVVRELMTAEESTANNIRALLARARYEVAALVAVDPGARRVNVAVEPTNEVLLFDSPRGDVDYAKALGECERLNERLEEKVEALSGVRDVLQAERDKAQRELVDLTERHRDLVEAFEQLEKKIEEGGGA